MRTVREHEEAEGSVSRSRTVAKQKNCPPEHPTTNVTRTKALRNEKESHSARSR